MGAIGSAIKAEIVRLSRREARKLTAPLRASNLRLKKRIIGLSTRINSLEQQIQRMQAKEKLTETNAKAASGQVTGRLSPGLIRALRKRLGLPRHEFAKLIGVSTGSVFGWETGKVSPRAEVRAKIMAFRGMGRREVKSILASH